MRRAPLALGLLTGFAFVVLYTVTGVPLARLADRADRVLVLAGARTLWSLATAACGLAGSFAGLIVARVFVGIGESGCQPIGYALLADQRYRWLLAVNGTHSFLIFGPVAWLPAFFMRSHGLPLRTVGTWTGLAIEVGMGVGMLIGGLCADRLLRRSASAPQWFCCATAVATGAAYVVVLTLADPSWAVATLPISLLGVGLAPFVIGRLSDAFTPALGTDALRYAMLATLPVCLLTAVLHARLAGLMRDPLSSVAIAA